MSVTTRFALTLTTLGALGVGAQFIPACTPTETAGPQGVDSGPVVTGSYCGDAGSQCCAAAGQIPNPECDDGTESACPTTPSACKVQEPECGSTSTCEPLANNTGTTKDFRMRRIILAAPPALASTTVQNLVVNGGVDMNEPQCGNPPTGTGEFSWLISLDTTNNKLKTGGAPPCDIGNSPSVTGTPSCDPFTSGYCFVNKTVGTTLIQPVTVPVSQASDGTYFTNPADIPILNIPIYFGSGTAAAPSSIPPSIIILPISNGAVTGMKVSTDGNCVGSVNTLASAGDCTDTYVGCSKWLTAGSLTGYITLKAANSVQISLLNRTLCALLTSDESGTPLPNGEATCAVDANGNPTAPGDYCSTTNSPGGCKDSFWLAATFAASAVTINSGTGVPDCLGGSEDAGGGDAGASDSGAADTGAGDGGAADTGAADTGVVDSGEPDSAPVDAASGG
jgi:hypothetical protein